MKSKIIKILAATLACIMLVGCMAGCSSKGEKFMELDGSEITSNMFMLLMSRMKGTLAATLGNKVNTQSFWDTVRNAQTGETNDDYYTDAVLESAKTYIAALALFDELGLKLPDSYIDEIDTAMDNLVEDVGEGSKSYLNSMLAEYGANYTVLRETYIMEAKISYLSDYLFGADGSRISEENYESYYQENYVRFKHVFFYTVKPVYETDENDDVIYYKDLSADPLRIAYITKSDELDVRKKTDADGKVVTDKNGDVVWVYTDGDGKERIAYDKGSAGNPTYPSPVLGEDGYVLTQPLSTEEAIELSDRVQIIMESVKTGEYTLFDNYVEKYGEDPAMDKYTNGYYLTATSDYDAPEVRDALFEMEEGEIRRIEPENGYGIHIVMKYRLDESGYAEKDNKDFFRNDNGTYAFLEDMKNVLLEVYLGRFKTNITIKEDVLKKMSMKNVKANYNY